ncbi:G-protein beta WD- 40 repeats containing protein [Penicillium canescens]|nr:G-protein beta WD- 40 repeats containing protein [Penicillium canescens]
MMSIGLIEELSRVQREPIVVAYFFCQNADNELNTLESILKGLILRLVNQQTELKVSLRRRWDTKNERFNEDVNLWRNLWNILLEMMDRSTASKIYMIVDGLDECQDGGIADFLKLIVRNGLDRPAKIKWLLTSRPLDSAERALLTGNDQVQVSLELNSNYVSEAVKSYIAYKVDELSRYHKYGQELKMEMKMELSAKAEGTFLWVSLACKRLESVHQDEALTTIQDLPPGLYPFYDRILNQLSEGDPDDVYNCMRLLKAMMLAYRPLKVEEVPSVTGLTNNDGAIEALVNRCASFLRMQESNIEFVHQSTRDYLAEENGQSILDSYEQFGHYEIVLGCLSHLSERLKVNLLDLPRPNSTREDWKPLKDERNSVPLSSLDYAATFWVQHLESIKRSTILQSGLIEKVSLACSLPQSYWNGLRTFAYQFVKDHPSELALVQDATQFLLRHYQTLTHWPLQIYSSAITLCPEASVVKRNDLGKIPVYLRRVPVMEDSWSSLIQTLRTHSNWVTGVAFSPDGKQIASGSYDHTIKLWDTAMGDVQETLEGHSDRVTTVAFSPNGKQIASGSGDHTIRLWDAETGDLQKTLEGHSNWVTAVVFSPDGKQIVSGSHDHTIKLWDAKTGDVQKTLEGHSDRVTTVAFSPNGKQIASGSGDHTIKLWDVETGDLQKTLECHSNWVTAMTFSPDGRQIASDSHGYTVKIWDTTTGDVQKTLEGHSGRVTTVAFSPDGKQVVSGSHDHTIKLWDTTTDDVQKTLEGHSDLVTTVAFSPDGKQIASGSYDHTVKVWDTTMNDLKKPLDGHSDSVTDVAFSPDGKQIASGSYDHTVKIWDTKTGHIQNTLEGHSDRVTTVAFSLDGKQVASGSGDHTIKLWDAETGNLQKTLEGHSSWVTDMAFSPDGKQIASFSFLGRTVKLWNTKTGRIQNTLEGHSSWVTAVAFSPDGRQIVSGSHDDIKLWDTTTGNLRKTLEGHSGRVTTVAFSPDGKQIASLSFLDRTIRFWDITASLKTSKSVGRHLSRFFKLRPWKEITASRLVSGIKFSACNRYLITDIGPIMLQGIATESQDESLDILLGLSVRHEWICYGDMPFFRLPADSQSIYSPPTCHVVQGDGVALGFENGRVWRFDIDRSSMQSMLEHTPSVKI